MRASKAAWRISIYNQRKNSTHGAIKDVTVAIFGSKVVPLSACSIPLYHFYNQAIPLYLHKLSKLKLSGILGFESSVYLLWTILNILWALDYGSFFHFLTWYLRLIVYEFSMWENNPQLDFCHLYDPKDIMFLTARW